MKKKTSTGKTYTRSGRKVVDAFGCADSVLGMIDRDSREQRIAHRRIRVNPIYANALLAHVWDMIDASGIDCSELPMAAVICERIRDREGVR